MLVTPDQARRWLCDSYLNQDPQRRIRLDVCREFARRMVAGEWTDADPQTVYKPVRIMPGGYIIDGHTRLHAVALADVPAEMDVRICK